MLEEYDYVNHCTAQSSFCKPFLNNRQLACCVQPYLWLFSVEWKFQLFDIVHFFSMQH